MRIAQVVQDSIVDGPGFRLAVFTQGCPHGCPGCHNPETHDFSGGTEMTVEEIIEKLKKNPLMKGLTLSGGEPFCQAEECTRLAELARENGVRNVWAYSGWTFEQLLNSEDSGKISLLRQLDVLVDGPFILSQRSLAIPWRGSKNQRLIDVKASLEAGTAVEWQPA
ncbi:MAG: anaerobic ribonucleoside-triphosphate reductase activating protein [Oscillospiraceae bacterium]|nr:anaerobic ribonucleoside-triphosphate reductase activating protein [Oscillospiraceae bacterium]